MLIFNTIEGFLSIIIFAAIVKVSKNEWYQFFELLRKAPQVSVSLNEQVIVTVVCRTCYSSSNHVHSPWIFVKKDNRNSFSLKQNRIFRF